MAATTRFQCTDKVMSSHDDGFICDLVLRVSLFRLLAALGESSSCGMIELFLSEEGKCSG